MKLTKSLDIALMILVQLAAKRKQLSTADLARLLDAPRNHVMKVVQILTRGGYIRTLRGKRGGVQLARSPEQVSLQETVDLVEGPTYLMECTLNPGVCPFSLHCRLRLKLGEAQEGMMKVFRATALTDLIPATKK